MRIKPLTLICFYVHQMATTVTTTPSIGFLWTVMPEQMRHPAELIRLLSRMSDSGCGRRQPPVPRLFWFQTYPLINLTCFWVICSLSTDGKNLMLDDLNGLYKQAPYLAFVLAVGAFALVGLPPTAGFMGKLFLLTAAWNRGYITV